MRRFDNGKWPELPLDESLDSTHAVLRVLCRLEYAWFSAYQEDKFQRWYQAGREFIETHLGNVVWGRV